MKVLLDVFKSLLLINAAVVLPSFLLVMALYKQQSTNVAVADNVSSKFHRDIQDDTPKYQQKLEELEVQKNQLQAKLKASEKAKTATSVVADRPSVNKLPTQVSPVSYPQATTVSSTPSVKKPVLAKAATVSQTKRQPKPSRQSVRRTPVSLPQKTEVTVNRREKQPSAVAEGHVAVNRSNATTLSSNDKLSDEKMAKATPKDFIGPDNWDQTPAKQRQDSIVAPQATTPIKEHITLANDLSVGLIVADNRGELKYGSRNYKKVQTAILSLRKGSSQSLEDAAQLSGLDLDILKWLAQYGQNRPGSFNPVAISMNPE